MLLLLLLLLLLLFFFLWNSRIEPNGITVFLQNSSRDFVC
jgi:hypothetical protein